ncbi:MAG: cbb3-type cytochrome c oxidase subunit II [Verrucomicrobiales bacterium]|nr:cbb3-type cytochrome c oxidase subunit II [Verrucomicrobiales bacterium]
MNRIPILFLGIFAAVASSFWGVIFVPQMQLGQSGLAKIEDTGSYYPVTRTGEATRGADVYRANGCVECHTQQVRPKGLGSDYERGWGKRRTIAQDYLLDQPALLGSLRLGPDLANAGRRQPNATVQLQHLYNPQLTVPRSTMPRYPYLFSKRKLAPNEKPSAQALPANTEPGFEVVPKPEAIALAAYLLSLNSEAPLFSAPFPATKTNAPAKTAAASSVK